MLGTSSISLPLTAVWIAASVAVAAASPVIAAPVSLLPGLVHWLDIRLSAAILVVVFATLGTVRARSGSAGCAKSVTQDARTTSSCDKVTSQNKVPGRVEVLHLAGGLRSSSDDVAPTEIDCSIASGRYYVLHRPMDMDSKEHAASASYFRGKRRHWEFRFQMTFKKTVKASELRLATSPFERPVVSAKQVALQRMVFKFAGPALGGFYNTLGDNPMECADDELEQPETSVPICEADQIIETLPGQDPPDLTAGDFPKQGRLKVTDPKAFRRDVNERVFAAGETYTFAFWGPSRAGNVITWQMDAIPMLKGVSLDSLNGPPPIVFSFYALSPSTGNDHRHLESRKSIVMRAAVWSSLHPPRSDVLRKLGISEGREAAVPTIEGRTEHCGTRLGVRNRLISGVAMESGCCWCGIGRMLQNQVSRCSVVTKAALLN